MNKFRNQTEVLFLSEIQNMVQKRKVAKLTQTEMARRSGVEVRTIKRFEAYQCNNLKVYLTYKSI